MEYDSGTMIKSFKHKLSGRDQEVWSVWVNGNWRITFEFLGKDAYLIDYRDYH